ncbi:MAG: hypothetical protein A3F12_01860 [Gammaproteobacteria bacterium RIFCSPHIGHO2_12_FULL_38_14]|nr:MAG: hypothetical protein A3F12_01860 [Gammaproteobacteria bacterium RIFCSPHIGHO2_12_FULL_38_14]
MISTHQTLFNHLAKLFSPFSIKTNDPFPFKDHHQFSVLIDIISRKYTHHALIHAPFSSLFYPFFLEAFSHHLLNEQMPDHLKSTELLHLPFNLIATQLSNSMIENDFKLLLSRLDEMPSCLLIAISGISSLFQLDNKNALHQKITQLIHHPKCRLLIFTSNHQETNHHFFHAEFHAISIKPPSRDDHLAILKKSRLELEHYHHILIPEEILPIAYGLAERYLSVQNPLEKTLLLLDSCASRLISHTQQDPTHASPALLTNATLLNVLSSWTQISTTHLATNTFNASTFIDNMQQKIFGQESAITTISHALQETYAQIKQTNGPFASFLFAGPKHAGKKTTSIALAEYMFKQTNMLYFAHLIQPTLKRLLDLPLKAHHTHEYASLRHVISQTPFAIILIENIEEATTSVIEDLYQVLNTGYMADDTHQQYCFRQAIFILTTTLGTDHILVHVKPTEPSNEEPQLDLLQLVMNEQKQRSHTHLTHSPQEIVDHILPELSQKLSPSLCHLLHVVPFFPHHKEALEKIIRLKLKTIGKTLYERYNIELGYAPEVIRYLTREIIKQEQGNTAINLNKILKSLYFNVEHIIMNQRSSNQHTNQLFLQLNETGQSLRSAWLSSVTTMRQHAT